MFSSPRPHLPVRPRRPRPASPLRRGTEAVALFLAAFLSLLACANPGSGPDGGPYDEDPPRIVSTSPALGARNTKARKVTLLFNEMVKLENASEKIIVSPPQTNVPEIKTAGRRITVELTDSLRPHTTYTIDFSDAIEDMHEGNPMGNYTYYFSTGTEVDTMEVAGHVLAAANLEPVKGILVGLHADLADSAFRCKPFDRVARTDGNGRFSIKGVARGTYRIYALQDRDGDFRFSQKSEMIAFSRDTISPSCFQDLRHDTLWVDTVRYDTVKTVTYTHFLPDDVVLLAFQERNQPRHFLKAVREEPESFTAYFTAPSAHAPVVTGIGFDAATALLEQHSPGNDTLTYWLCDTTLLARDTLSFVYTYEETDDSTGLASLRSDTLELVPKKTMARRLKEQADARERWMKQQEKQRKHGRGAAAEPPRDYMKINARIPSSMAPDQNIFFSLPQPVARLDTAALHLLLGPDSAQVEAPFRLEKQAGSLSDYVLYGEWRPGQHYSLHIDSAGIRSIYGLENKRADYTFSIAQAETFATLFVHMPGADTATVVQLLSSDNKVEKQQRLIRGRADFYYVKPGTYYLRAFTDRNGNNRWDSGLFAESEQAEAVRYYHKTLVLRANWDIEETWLPDDRPLTRQKPAALVKQKDTKTKQTARSRNIERERNR